MSRLYPSLAAQPNSGSHATSANGATTDLPRRALLRRVLASLAAPALPAGAWANERVLDQPFTLGVASACTGPGRIVLWTRLLPAHWPDRASGFKDYAVQFEVAQDERFKRIVQHGQATAHAALAHSVHVTVSGLEADHHYFYRFRVGDAISRTGRTRTFAAPGSAQAALRLAYASCQKWEDGHFTAWQHMAADQPDAVLFLGDYIYEYPGNRSHIRVPGGGWVITLDEYRRRHALYKTDAHLQAMHAACPWFFTWDDHEVQNDYAGTTPGDGGPAGWQQRVDFAERRAAAYQAYFEHMPIDAPDFARALLAGQQGAELRLYRQHHFGDLAHLVLLDTRQYRDAQVCTRDGRTGSDSVIPQTCPQWDDATRSLLGHAQEQWLAHTWAREARNAHGADKAATAARWHLIGQQTLVAPRDFRPGPQQLFWNDGWDGYPAARRRLLQALQASKLPNAVFLGGDVHENWVGHVMPDGVPWGTPGAQPLAVEFCGTGLTSRNATATPEKTERMREENPHFVFADAQHRGYGLMDLSPQRVLVQLRVLDDATQPQTQVSTLARFEVLAGQSRVHRLA